MGELNAFGRRLAGLRAVMACLVIFAIGGSMMPAARGTSDTTPPVGSWDVWEVNNKTAVAELRFSFSDAQSGVTQLIVSCDGGPEKVYPYSAKLFLDLRDASAGGCGHGYFKQFWIWVRAVNGVGLESAATADSATVTPHVELRTPKAPVTGEPYTIDPVWPADYTLPSTARCNWEFRWGSTKALNENALDGTYGGIVFQGPKSGFCKAWTFTLPWAPVAQYQVSFDWIAETSDYNGGHASIGMPQSERGFIVADVGSTSRHITESTIPLTYVVTDKQELVVGQQVTATRYSAGGLSITGGFWHADQATESGTLFTQQGGNVFKFTPNRAGVWVVAWDWWSSSRLFAFYHDPLARKAGSGDTTRPLASPPMQKLEPGTTAGGGVPVTLSWGGSDGGSGLHRFVLQRSKNGGVWRNVALPSPLATSLTTSLATGSRYRFRVRAIDNAGNRSDWKLGPPFKPAIVQESASAIGYTGSWSSTAEANALGGNLRSTPSSTARATYTFTGRDIAWVAQRGPGMGMVDVYIDGALAQTVDLAAGSATYRQIVFTRHWAARGTHTISIRNRGTSGRPQATLDALLVLR